MASVDRPFSEVLASIFGNIEDIVRSELKLAKAEVGEEVAKATHALGWIAAGVLSALFALGFLLVAGFCALLHVVPNWAAALIIAAGLGLFSAIVFQVYGSKRKLMLNQAKSTSTNALPQKENLAWAKHQVR